MLAEWRGLEYTFEILRILSKNEVLDSKQIGNVITTEGRVESTLSYIQKILPRMVRAGLLKSSGTGYSLAKPITQTMVSDVLLICTMPHEDSPLSKVCGHILEALSLTSVDEFYDFT